MLFPDELSNAYVITREISSRLGCVLYEGLDAQTNVPVAIKCIDTSVLEPGSKARVHHGREMHIHERVSAMDGPHIVKLLRVIRSKCGIDCLVTDLYDGTLSDCKDYPMSTKLSVMEQVAAAVAFLHDHRIVHRDIKPANIFIRKQDRCKLKADLGDFGLAIDTAKVRPSSRCGSIAFVAPEVYEGSAYDRAVDIWSLGKTFACMLLGRKYEYVDSSKTLLDLRFADDAGVSSELRRLIARCMSRDPCDRPSAHEVHSQILEMTKGCQ